MNKINTEFQNILKLHIEKEYETTVRIEDEDIIFEVSNGSIKYQVYCLILSTMMVIHLYTGIKQEENNIEILKLLNILNDRTPAGSIASRDNEEILIKIHIFDFAGSNEDIKNFDASIGMLFASVDQYIPAITAVNSGFTTAEAVSNKIFKRSDEN